jgi:uncharacterized protein YjdB
VVLSRIVIEPGRLDLIAGATGVMRAQATYSDGTQEDVSDRARWRSSDAAVAAPGRNLPGEGREIVALGEGRASFTATFDGVESGPATVSVVATQVIEIQLDPPAATLSAGSVQDFTALALFNDGTAADITDLATWRSSNLVVAEVVSDGVDRGRVTARAAGIASITAQYADVVSTPVRVEVTNALLRSIEVTSADATAPVGTSVRFAASGLYSDGSRRALDAQVSFVSSDVAVANFAPAPAEPGTLLALAPGATQVTATLGAITSAPFRFTVTAARLDRLELSGGAPSIPIGQTTRFTATGFFSDGVDRDTPVT